MKEDNILKNLSTLEAQKYEPQNNFPCFYVDFVEELCPGKYVKGIKNYTYNEWYMPAHFPDEPNVPGFVQIETMAQFFLLTFLSLPEYFGKKVYVLKSVANFKKKILPGDTLEVFAELISVRRGIAVGKVEGRVKGQLVCTLDITECIQDELSKLIPRG